MAEPWRAYVAPERISVIYNGVAGPPPRPAGSRRRARAARLAASAASRRRRDSSNSWRAAAIIHGAVAGLPVRDLRRAAVFRGGRLEYDAEVRAAAAGLPVEFAGWATDVYDALADLDLLLVPSAAHEATTRVILEAFAAGVPVIAFRSGGIPEVVDHDVDGLLAGSSEEMARMAVDLLSWGSRAAALDVPSGAGDVAQAVHAGGVPPPGVGFDWEGCGSLKSASGHVLTQTGWHGGRSA